ncbi:tail fiber domain-containing protein [Pedobacter hiemivivus]|uniref:Tail fiber domain-containing protein n=1 Tax=Pedobacter hiemivivus TaxID=2530454 RepID=A0A4R0N9X8_9SPHI|nr:tail fiber domain-containing protein [Pedobacter hiemivivus]TCC96990.1 tail fiber domain-containing protein [Pedobacter hiemivivus]
MKYLIFKGAFMALLLSASTLTVSAQKIDEQELKVSVGKISNSTQHLKNLEPVTFKYDVNKYKHLKLPAGEQYGFLASNVQPEFPAMVYEASKVYESGKNNSKVAKYNEVQTADLIPVLVAAIKEQQAEIELLKNEVKLLKAKSK